ncbi:MAG: imelysin family protein, partial [Pseudomonadota bacterium]
MNIIFKMAVAFICAGVAFGPAKAQARFDSAKAKLFQDALITTANEFIVPGYQAWAVAAAAMKRDLQASCSGGLTIDDAQTRFEETFLAWQRISIIQYGPIADGKGLWRAQIWPDPKGFSKRAIRTALAKQDAQLLQQSALEKQSVALVNLTALEELLYADLKPNTYACDLSVAIASYQANLSAKVAAEWVQSPFRTAFDTAAKGNERYPNIETLMREVLAGAVVYTDRLRKFKLQRGLGASSGQARPERSEARKSGLGLKSIETSFRALKDFYDVPYGFFDVTPDAGGSMEFFALGETAASISDTLAVESRTLEAIL